MATIVQSVYVIGPDVKGPVKIGIANNPKYRLAKLQTGFPENLYLYWSSVYDNAKAMEASVHNALNAQRLNGEWFDISLEKAIETITTIVPEPWMSKTQLREARRQLKEAQRQALLEQAIDAKNEAQEHPMLKKVRQRHSLAGLSKAQKAAIKREQNRLRVAAYRAQQNVGERRADKIAAELTEAAAIAKGEAEPASVTVISPADIRRRRSLKGMPADEKAAIKREQNRLRVAAYRARHNPS